MANVKCSYCGDEYPQEEKACPLCGAPNDNYSTQVVEAAAPMAGNTTKCEFCGDEYEAFLPECPLCGEKNPLVSDISYDDTNNAELVDEESDFNPKQYPKKKQEYKKQAAPNSTMVLICFIGIIVIIISSFVSCASGIAKKQSSKIGTEIFNRQEIYYQQDY